MKYLIFRQINEDSFPSFIEYKTHNSITYTGNIAKAKQFDSFKDAKKCIIECNLDGLGKIMEIEDGSIETEDDEINLDNFIAWIFCRITALDHACLSGDCTHNKKQDCIDSIKACYYKDCNREY